MIKSQKTEPSVNIDKTSFTVVRQKYMVSGRLCSEQQYKRRLSDGAQNVAISRQLYLADYISDGYR